MQLIEIGHTMKPHGLAGEIKIHVEEQWEEAIESLKMVYLEVKGQKLPFFIDQIRGGGAMIASFEDINDRDAAQAISSKKMFAKEADLPAPTPVETTDVPDFVDFTVFTAEGEKLGLVTEMVEYPHQILAVVEYQGREVMIPVVDAFFKEVRIKKREIVVDLPEGLLDL